MRKQNINYRNGLIYKIISKEKEKTDCYVGSTTNLKQRKSCHKTRSLHSKQSLYEHIRNNGGWDNFRIILVEKYPCGTKKELQERERYWIEKQGNLNEVIPGRTLKERGTPQYKEYQKEWFQANKWRLSQKQYERRKKERETTKTEDPSLDK